MSELMKQSFRENIATWSVGMLSTSASHTHTSTNKANRFGRILVINIRGRDSVVSKRTPGAPSASSRAECLPLASGARHSVGMRA
eukprot:113671-Prymnesium_polylepis.1